MARWHCQSVSDAILRHLGYLETLKRSIGFFQTPTSCPGGFTTTDDPSLKAWFNCYVK